MKHVVMFSGGIGSWATAKRVVERYGTDDLTLLFTDTLIEDEDLYRFLDEAASNLGVPVTRLAEGRDVWQVFNDERFLGNSRIDPCSKILKRQMADRWLKANCDPVHTRVYVGIDWSESHRFIRLAARRWEAGWTYCAPLCEAPYLLRNQMFQWLRDEGIAPPRLYGFGFSHNNCGGFCVKAGKGHFARLLKAFPDRYAYHEAQEQKIRAILGDVSIMTDRDGDKKIPLTMQAFRERVEAGKQIDMFDIGGCGCFIDDDEATTGV